MLRRRPDPSSVRTLNAARGMTLMEIIVVTAVIALVMTGLTMGIGTLTRQKLSSSSIRVAAAVRTAYSRSATTGKTIRLVFDIDESLMWMEEAEGGRVLLSANDDEDEDDEDEDGEGADDGIGAQAQAKALASVLGDDPGQLLSAARGAAESDLGDDMNMDMLGALGGLGSQSGIDLPTPRYRVPRFSPAEGRLGKRVRLESGVLFQSVATMHRESPAEEGRAYLYFFPGGISELAVIQLRDSRGFVNSVEVHPLTGRCRIHDVPYEMPVTEDDRNEAREVL